MKKMSVCGLLLLVSCLLASCNTSKQQKGQEVNINGQDTGKNEVMTFTSNSNGNRPLPNSPYGYEMWTHGGNDNKLI
jgi:predicted small secreted protein